MDCLQAQQVLSEAVDHEPVAPEALSAAREHCRSCADCARFVRGLALLQRAESPTPSPELPSKVLAAVEAERAARAQLHAAPAVEPTVEPDAPVAAEVPPIPVVTPVHPVLLSAARRRAHQRSVLAWAGAAAAVLIVAAFAALAGVRGIILPRASSVGSPSTGSTSAPRLSSGENSGGTSTSSGYSYDALKKPGESQEGTTRALAIVARDFITVNETAYRLVGTVSIPRSELTNFGTTNSALGTGRAARALSVFTTSTPGRVVVIADDETLAFDVVSRNLGGRAYVLTCDPISAFGIWPKLPRQFITPTTADGAPTFVSAQKDDLGVQVYARPGTPVSEAFAVAPGTAGTDPASGNPNWTWWTLAR